jgi:Ca2+-binding EF-hand superfamily protein
LNIGLTNNEIDQIIFKSGKESHDGNLNLREFIKYLYSTNTVLQEGNNNICPIMEEIKSLIYKYYSNPIICFESNDKKHTGQIDFDNYKNIIYDMYNKEEVKIPNFALIKNSFDSLDLRKDGVIDRNEWCKGFASFNGKLDFKKENVTNGLEFYDKKFKFKNNFQNTDKVAHNRKILRDWETSGDIAYIYKYINKNRKLIQDRMNQFNYVLSGEGAQLIHCNNLIAILKDIIPGLKLSQTQWKMIVNVGQNERTDGFINIKDFFNLMKVTSESMNSHPTIKKRKNKLSLLNDYSGFNCNSIGHKTMTNGYYYNRRSNSINKDPKSFKHLSSKYTNPNTYLETNLLRGKSSYKFKGLTAIA